MKNKNLVSYIIRRQIYICTYCCTYAYTRYYLAESVRQVLDINKIFAGQVKPHGSSRVGSADPTRPAKILRCVDLTRLDPRDFESLSTRPDPTGEI